MRYSENRQMIVKRKASNNIFFYGNKGSEAALYYQNLYGMFFAQAIERCAKRMDNSGRIVGISSPGIIMKL